MSFQFKTTPKREKQKHPEAGQAGQTAEHKV